MSVRQQTLGQFLSRIGNNVPLSRVPSLHQDIMTWIMDNMDGVEKLYEKMSSEALFEEIETCVRFFSNHMFDYHMHRTVQSTDILDLEEMLRRVHQDAIPSLSLRIRDDDDLIESKLWDSPACHLWEILSWAFFYMEPTKEALTKEPVSKQIAEFIKVWPCNVFIEGEEREYLLRELYVMYNRMMTGFVNREEEMSGHERFTPMWFFMIVSCSLDPTYLFPDYDPDTALIVLDPVERESISVLIKEFLETWKVEVEGQFEFVRILQHMMAFPGIREMFIYEQIFDKEEESYLNEIMAHLLRPNRTQKAILSFQPQHMKKINEFNYEIDDLISLFFDSDNPPFAFADSVKLLAFHYYIETHFIYKGWLWKTVVPLEAFHRHRHIAMQFSQTYPLILQLEPYRYRLLFQGEARYGTIESVLYQWIVASRQVGMPNTENPHDIPWCLTWAKWMPRYVNPEKLGSTEPYKFNIVFKNSGSSHSGVTRNEEIISLEEPDERAPKRPKLPDALDLI